MPTIVPRHDAHAAQSVQTGQSHAATARKIIQAHTGMQMERPAPVEAAIAAVEENQSQDKEIGQPNTVVAEKSVALSPQLAALARKEAKYRQQEQELKAKEAAFESKKTEFASFSSLKEKLAAKDFSALEELGIDYNEYTNYLLAKQEGQKPEAQAIEQLREEITGLKKSQEEAVNKQYDATVNQYRAEIKALVAKDPEYSTVKELAAEEYVVKHILDTFNEDGDVLTVEEASKEIEEALVEEAMKMSNLSKVKAKQAPPAPEKKALPPPAKPGLRTLTNTVAPTGAKTFPQMQHLSVRERLAAAVQKAQKQG